MSKENFKLTSLLIVVITLAAGIILSSRREANDFEQRRAQIEISTSDMLDAMARQAQKNRPQSVCVDGSMNVQTVNSLPAEAPDGSILFQWTQRELYARSNQTWMAFPRASYKVRRGRCEEPNPTQH